MCVYMCTLGVFSRQLSTWFFEMGLFSSLWLNLGYNWIVEVHGVGYLWGSSVEAKSSHPMGKGEGKKSEIKNSSTPLNVWSQKTQVGQRTASCFLPWGSVLFSVLGGHVTHGSRSKIKLHKRKPGSYKCQTDKYTSQTWYAHTMKYYSVMKREQSTNA